MRPKVICLTPVKNEAWILDIFLKCTSLWADYIIVVDQNSDDGSCEIAKAYPKVILVKNNDDTFDEAIRQKLLINAAREIEGEKFLIALDADELLTPNVIESKEWRKMLMAMPGTVVYFDWVNIKPDMNKCWIHKEKMPFGFMDDGSDHMGKTIHSVRIPHPSGAYSFGMNDVKVMHLQYVHWERMESKHRWYQCWEKINNPNRSAIDIYRQYHHMNSINETDIIPFAGEWFSDYKKMGIDISIFRRENKFRWDKAVLDNINLYGAEKFEKEDIWSVNWEERAAADDYKDTAKFSDPRSDFNKKIHRWLENTQSISDTTKVRILEFILKKFFAW